MDSIVKVLFITDEGYCLPTSVAISSVIKNKKSEQEYEVYVICRDLSDESKEKLTQLNGPEVKIVLIDGNLPEKYWLYSKNDGDAHTTSSALMKFFAPNILSNVDKAIYLDGDVIVQEDLFELYSVDISDCYAAVVKDLISDNREYLNSIDYDGDSYFNTGMMVMNLSKIRDDKIVDKLSFQRIHGKNHFVDQDAYNIVFKDKVRYLPLKYNMLNKYFEWRSINYLSEFYNDKLFDTAKENMMNAVVLHLGGAEKPWKYEMGFLSSLYKEYYYESPYKDTPLKLVDFQSEKYEKEMKRASIEYVFPFDYVDKSSKIVLYGAGKIGVQYYKQIKALDYCKVVAWVDQKNIQGCVKICDALALEFDYIVITTMDRISAEDIKTNLIKLGVDRHKIIYSNRNMMFENWNVN